MMKIIDADYPVDLLNPLLKVPFGSMLKDTIVDHLKDFHINKQRIFNHYGCNHDNASVTLSAAVNDDTVITKLLMNVCSEVAHAFGQTWNGKQVLSLSLIMLASSRSQISITMRRTWPLPSTPMPPNCRGPKLDRIQCPRCKYWNAVGNTSPFCSTCSLFMKSSHEQIVLAEQLPPQPNWKKIGSSLTYELHAYPLFLDRRHRRINPPYETASEYTSHMTPELKDDQIKSFKIVRIGPYPTLKVLSELLDRKNKYPEVVFSKDTLNTRDMPFLISLIDAAKKVNAKKSFLRTTCTVDPSDLTKPTSYFKIKLELYLDVNANSSNSSFEKFWGFECQILCSFLSEHSMSSNINEILNTSVKTSCEERDILLTSCPVMEAGSYSNLPSSLVDLLEGVIRESHRLGYLPPGFPITLEPDQQQQQQQRSSSSSNNAFSFLFDDPLKTDQGEADILRFDKDNSNSNNYHTLSTLTNNNNNLSYLNEFEPDDHHKDTDSDDDSIHLSYYNYVDSEGVPQNGFLTTSNSGIYVQALGTTDSSDQLSDTLSTAPSESNDHYYNSFNESNIFKPPTEIQMRRRYAIRNNVSVLLTELENLGYPMSSVSLPLLSTSSTSSTFNTTVSSSSNNNNNNNGSVYSNYLTIQLRDYQKQTLAWALQQEHLRGGILSHITAPLLDTDGKETGVWMSPITGEFRKTPPKDIRGGFICDEMGMGKTIVTLALVLSHPAPCLLSSEEQVLNDHWGDTGYGSNIFIKFLNMKPEKKSIPISSSTGISTSVRKDLNTVSTTATTTTTTSTPPPPRYVPLRSKATLVVCPVSLVSQWNSEAKQKIRKSDFKIIGYHGATRCRNLHILAGSDLVITTYETLATELRTFLSQSHHKKSSKKASSYCIFNINWHRVVLDESHRIKGQCSNSNAVNELISKRRWCVTGTPVNTKIADFAGQFKFIGVPGLDCTRCWSEAFSKPYSRLSKELLVSGVHPEVACASFMSVLRGVVMRHTKSMKYSHNQEPLLILPPKFEEVFLIQFSDKEKETYLKLEKTMSKKFKNVVRLSVSGLHNNTIRVLAILKDLQTVCSGGIRDDMIAELLTNGTLTTNFGGIFGECPICMEIMEDPLTTLCGHIFCSDCIYGTIDASVGEGRSRCPLCRRAITIQSLTIPIPPPPPPPLEDTTNEGNSMISKERKSTTYDNEESNNNDDVEEDGNSQKIIMNAYPVRNLVTINNKETTTTATSYADSDDDSYDPKEDDGDEAFLPPKGSYPHNATSHHNINLNNSLPEREVKLEEIMTSKLTWLLNKLQEIRRVDHTAKILLFSQFNSTLQWLQIALPLCGFQFRTLTGVMSLCQRDTAMEEFRTDPPSTIFLLSMRAGAVGINLTLANHVIVMEPCLNPALEEQAIGRVHRMGQKRPIYVYRLAYQDSVEERIIQLWRIRNHSTTTSSKINNRNPTERAVGVIGGNNNSSNSGGSVFVDGDGHLSIIDESSRSNASSSNSNSSSSSSSSNSNNNSQVTESLGSYTSSSHHPLSPFTSSSTTTLSHWRNDYHFEVMMYGLGSHPLGVTTPSYFHAINRPGNDRLCHDRRHFEIVFGLTPLTTIELDLVEDEKREEEKRYQLLYETAAITNATSTTTAIDDNNIDMNSILITSNNEISTIDTTVINNNNNITRKRKRNTLSRNGKKRISSLPDNTPYLPLAMTRPKRRSALLGIANIREIVRLENQEQDDDDDENSSVEIEKEAKVDIEDDDDDDEAYEE